MRPLLHPRLVNGPFGDPGLFIETLYRRDALLIDLGDLGGLSPRELRRVAVVCVSHLHVDHFIGFDALLRANIGREMHIRLFGPPGLNEAVGHKLAAYLWDLAAGYKADLVFDVEEIGAPVPSPRARFRLKTGFQHEELSTNVAGEVWTMNFPAYDIEAAVLQHHGPCLGYAIAERAHVNVWTTRLSARGLRPGPWLRPLKDAVRTGAPDERVITMPDGAPECLGNLRDLVTTARGQKIAYVTDVVDSPSNRAVIGRLARDADIFFIEASFAAADSELARQRCHLTTTAAGEIARAAGARRIEPFHFSPRYEGQENRLMHEVKSAFISPPA